MGGPRKEDTSKPGLGTWAAGVPRENAGQAPQAEGGVQRHSLCSALPTRLASSPTAPAHSVRGCE